MPCFARRAAAARHEERPVRVDGVATLQLGRGCDPDAHARCPDFPAAGLPVRPRGACSPQSSPAA